MTFTTERERELIAHIRSLRTKLMETRTGSPIYNETHAKLLQANEDLRIEREMNRRHRYAIDSLNSKPGLSPDFYKGMKTIAIMAAIVLLVYMWITGDLKAEGVATRLMWTVLVAAVGIYIFGYIYHKSTRK